MPEITQNTERLPLPLREPVRLYARLVQEVAGENALALSFYGLVLAGEFVPVRQPARNVLVVQRTDLDLLRNLGEQGARFGKTGIAAPMVLTPEHITKSCDTFPLELLEIQQHHTIIFGKDYFETLTFRDEHMRMQCERELKTALIAMHQGLLRAGQREQLLHPLVLDASEELVRILRGILWMKDIREARPAIETVKEVEKMVGRKLPGILVALDAAKTHRWDSFRLLYDDIAALGSFVDAW